MIPQDEVVELLVQLVRNACVNDGSPTSGHEWRNADVLQQVVEGAGLEEIAGAETFAAEGPACCQSRLAE